MSDPEKEAPKIIVDGDWKEQVEKEKAAAASASEASSTAEPSTSEPSTAEPGSANDFVPKASGAEIPEEQLPPPPASFEILISMLFTQAMAMLGQIPDPNSGESKVNKPFAKHTIDTLEMLGEKTKGNLTDEESKILSEALHAVRMAYVNTKAS